MANGLLLTRRTVYAWLSLLGAMRVAQSEGGDLQELARRCPLPAGVIDLEQHKVVAAGPRLIELLGYGPNDLGSMTIGVLVDDHDLVDSLLDLLSKRAIDSYEVMRTLKRPDGSSVDANSWVTALPFQRNKLALWVVTPVDDTTPESPSDDPPTDWPTDVSGLVVGVFNAYWRIEQIGMGVEHLLGQPVTGLVDTSLMDLIHPDDIPDLLSVAARALLDQGSVGSEIRMLRTDSSWLPVRIVVTPLGGEKLRFGFAVAAAREPASNRGARVAQLERHLWNIAREIEESGIARGMERTPHPKSLPMLEHLSARQWEVLKHLLRGKRVPRIAEKLFISQSTVRNHLSGIFEKMGVKSQEELIDLVRGGDEEDGGTRPV